MFPETPTTIYDSDSNGRPSDRALTRYYQTYPQSVAKYIAAAYPGLVNRTEDIFSDTFVRFIKSRRNLMTKRDGTRFRDIVRCVAWCVCANLLRHDHRESNHLSSAWAEGRGICFGMREQRKRTKVLFETICEEYRQAILDERFTNGDFGLFFDAKNLTAWRAAWRNCSDRKDLPTEAAFIAAAREKGLGWSAKTVRRGFQAVERQIALRAYAALRDLPPNAI